MKAVREAHWSLALEQDIIVMQGVRVSMNPQKRSLRC